MKKLFLTLLLLILAPTSIFAQVPGQVPDKYSKTYADNVYIRYGNAQDFICGYNTTQTNDALVCGVSTDSETIILMQKADIGTNMGLADFGTPTYVIANSDPTKYMLLFNDGNGASYSSSSGTHILYRTSAGTVTITSADNDGTAAMTVLPGGAAALTLGGSSTTSVTTVTDDTGDAEEVHRVNSIGPSELVGVYKELLFCGENAENGATFFGPATALFGGDGSASYAIGSAGCDALDNVTEATADAPISALATKIHGMYCKTDGTLGASETLTFVLRTGAANAATTDGAATTLTCALAAGETECRVNTGTTTNIAAGATLAMSVTEVSNNADDNAWCSVMVSFP